MRILSAFVVAVFLAAVPAGAAQAQSAQKPAAAPTVDDVLKALRADL